MTSKKTPIAIVILILIVALFSVYIYRTARHGEPVALSPTDKAIAELEARTAKPNVDVKTYIGLANAYLQKIRETADTLYYDKIDLLMDQAEKIEPENPDIRITRAIVLGGRHHFAEALDLGLSAIQKDPHNAHYYGIVADAYVELGHYDEAVKTLQTMVNLRPDASSYSRISHVRELYGDIPGAISAMEEAIKAGSGFGENIAWGYVELGKLYFRTDIKKAEGAFEQALAILPDYPPALSWQARVLWAEGHKEKAQALFERAFEILPIAEYATNIADIATIQKNAGTEAKFKEVVKLTYEAAEKNGVNVDLEFALFLADHDLDLPLALSKAEIAYKERPSMYGADVLAWALYKNGTSKEAEMYAKEALRLGEHDSLLLFHAGMIAKENRNKKEAKRLLEKAIALNPNFSILYSSLAKETIQAL